jgi:hypothetical protein
MSDVFGSHNEQASYAVSMLESLLANPLRIPGETCSVCWTPVAIGATLCSKCAQHRWAFPNSLADRVIPLTYASDDVSNQIRYDLRQYKDGIPSRAQVAAVRLSYVVWYVIWRHGKCLTAVSGTKPSKLLLVPSGQKERAGGHPLRRLAPYLHLEELGVTRRKPSPAHALDPESLEVSGVTELDHVIVFDDTWTTGAAAQSAAIAAKRAGAGEVSIIVIGRWVNRSWDIAREFFERHPHSGWDPELCPITGGACPIQRG